MVWILKLGGSVITRKDVEDAPNVEAISRLPRELSGFSGLLVLGVGSFGHQRALRYRLWEGVEGKRVHWVDTRRKVQGLAMMVVNALVDAGVPALLLSLPSMVREGEMDFEGVRRLIDLGFVPVLHGDGFFDPERGLRVVSGDEVVYRAALSLEGVEGVIFAVDVDGIYDRDPKRSPGARILDVVTREELLRYAMETGDFSRGMRGKAEFISRIPREIPVYVVNGLVPGRIAGVLRGEVVGTKIV